MGSKCRINASFCNDKNDNKCVLYHLNIQGLESKRKSLESIVNKIQNVVPFNRNRSTQIMGGVATFVNRKYKDNFVKISEGEHNDEYLVTRHSNFKYPLNIINVYGEQEMIYSRTDVQDRWGRILNEVKKIEQRNELALIIGDLNKHVGNDATGVKDNHSKVTFGGELVRGLIASGDFICMNNSPKAFGGPFTRYDPSCPLKN